MEPVVHSVVRCHVALIPEDDGSFSAVVLNLPGVGSCGDTEEDAMSNVQDAIDATLASYHADGEDIPLLGSGTYEIPAGAVLKWVSVNA